MTVPVINKRTVLSLKQLALFMIKLLLIAIINYYLLVHQRCLMTKNQGSHNDAFLTMTLMSLLVNS